MLVNEFLEQTASQLTEFGLTTLNHALPERHLCVFFRNNHFATLFKRNDSELFLLCTDASVTHDDRIVWETLCDINQVSSTFLNSQFQHYSTEPSMKAEHHDPAVKGSEYYSDAGDYLRGPEQSGLTISGHQQQQLDQDYALALSLQEEEERVYRNRTSDGRRQSRQQFRQDSRLPPGFRASKGDDLYGVPDLTASAKHGKKDNNLTKSRISDEEFSRRMTEAFLPNEAQGSIHRRSLLSGQKHNSSSSSSNNNSGGGGDKTKQQRKKGKGLCIIC
ncbi:hypothetical protein EV182_001169 [Spiromyces aspiralis]|uniref:Uncharacterized protein n=1 Tax=Spiromyces aspiralis TaxID=68401 RepID=A0ACC1HGA0_9FUNG|nr:hypothetical protein EV182_001169 [Spiromyces aspiralis]